MNGMFWRSQNPQVSFGEQEVGFSGDTEIRATITDVNAYSGGKAHRAAFAHAGGGRAGRFAERRRQVVTGVAFRPQIVRRLASPVVERGRDEREFYG